MKKRGKIKILILTGLLAAVFICQGEAIAGPYDDAVSYWNFDDGSGSIATDSGTGGNNGTLTNMDPATDWVAGKVGDYALQLDGSNDYINVGTPASLNITGDLTISAWIKTSTVAVQPFIIQKYSSNAPWPGYAVRLWANDQTALWDGGTTWKGSAVHAVDDGQWHHIVITGFGSSGKFYFDGAEASGFTYAAPLDNSSAVLRIGSHYEAGSYNFNGTLDEVAIWDRALSSGEVGTLYNGGSGYDPAGGGSVPELPPYAMQVLVVISGAGFKWMKRKHGA